MELTIEQLLQGKATIIKGNEFFTTKAYAEPFLDRMSKYTDEFIINVKLLLINKILIYFQIFLKFIN